MSLHLNKGLAGAPAEAIDAALATATNPAVLDAFALLITGAQEQPAYPGIAGHEPDVALARRRAVAIRAAMGAVRRVAAEGGAYVSESDYFQGDWQRAFWGDHYPRLLAVKQRVDPTGLFFAHYGVGSERWSADGFTPVESCAAGWPRPRAHNADFSRAASSGRRLRGRRSPPAPA